MLAQKLIVGYSTKIFIQLIQIAASIVVARIAGPQVLGTVAFGLAYVSVFTFLADLGLGTAHIKIVSEGEDLGKCISTFTRLKTLITAFYFTLVLGFFLLQKYVIQTDFESVAHEYVILIMLFAVTIQQLLFIPYTTFSARTEQAKKDIPDFVRNILYHLFRIIVVIIGFKAITLAAGNLISTVLIIPLVYYLYKKYPRGGFDRKIARKYLKISLPILIIGMSTKVIHFLDKVILQYFYNSEQVGYYTAGYRIGGFVLLIANSVGMLFFPLFSSAVAQKDFEYIKDKINRFERFSFLFIMPLVILLALYSDMIINFILGEQYTNSITIMSTITIAMFFMVLNMPYGNVITGMGYFRLAAVINLINFAFFIVALLLLTNPNVFNLGARGAAIAVLMSNVLIGILYRIYAKKKCQVLEMRQGIEFFSYGILNFVLFSHLYHHLSLSTEMIDKSVFILIYFVCTYFSFYLLKWIKKEDWESIKKLIDFKSIYRYVKNEMRS